MKNDKTPTQSNAGAIGGLNGNNKQVNPTPCTQKRQALCGNCTYYCDTTTTRRERSLRVGKVFCYCSGKPTAAYFRACELFMEVKA